MDFDFDNVEQAEPDVIVHEADRRFGLKSLNLMNDLRKSETLCDVTICVGDKTFRAHKIVLASCSSYFWAMFTGDMAESQQDSIVMKEVDAHAMELLVEYAYTGRIEIRVETVQQILYAASLLQLPDVQVSCSGFLKRQLDPTNCLGIRNFADLHTCMDLVIASERYAQKHFSEVVKEEEFLLLPKQQLIDLISSEELNVNCEEEVYNAIMRWAYHDKELRKDDIADLLQRIRLPLLSPNFLVDTVEAEELIKQDIKCRDLLDEAKNYHMLPDRRSKFMREKVKPRKSTVGLVYCIGGMDTTSYSLNCVERYDFSSGKVSIVASMNTPRSGVGVTVIDGKIYAVGGHDGTQYLSSVECYDPATKRWRYVSSMTRPRRYVAVGTLNGMLYAVGGYTGTLVLDDVEMYNPKTNHWKFVPSMNCRRRHVGVGVVDGYLYAVGGHDGNNYLKSVERFDPDTNTWTMMCSMGARRGGVGVAVLGNRLYAMGGYDGTSNLSTLERYYPDDDRWNFVAPMNQCRSGLGVAVVGNLIYAIAGHDGAHYLNTVEIFDPHLGEWSSKGTIGSSRAVAGVAVLNDRV
uniref:Kelch-like protein 20-like n=1 Tax=Saccoglossus kowalevskii TaxID=10224 RepID=A0ABM0MHF9_SACKO|nr:PREDICTED: kelch-like protein 20-like [Saccoglossus kowalevskii]